MEQPRAEVCWHPSQVVPVLAATPAIPVPGEAVMRRFPDEPARSLLLRSVRSQIAGGWRRERLRRPADSRVPGYPGSPEFAGALSESPRR